MSVIDHASADVRWTFVGYEVDCSECGFIDYARDKKEAEAKRSSHEKWHEEQAAKARQGASGL